MTPQLQLALDESELEPALTALDLVASEVNVIEVGTILLLGEGLRAIREVRTRYPKSTICADARIAEAGGLIATHCFQAGADWVTCVAGASLDTIGRVVEVAHEYGGEVQVELGEEFSLDRAREWRLRGVEHVIVKRSRDGESSGLSPWGQQDIDRIRALRSLGLTVSVTGGIVAEDLGALAEAPVGVVIAGRAITAAQDPRAAATALRVAIDRTWP